MEKGILEMVIGIIVQVINFYYIVLRFSFDDFYGWFRDID